MTLRHQPHRGAQEFGHNRPDKGPPAVLFLFQAHHTCVREFDRPVIQTAGKQQRSKPLEMGKVADNNNLIRVNLQEICCDNGIIRRSYETLDVPEVRAYHLVPRGVSKASGVALHLERNGLRAGETADVRFEWAN